jgi:hypothetical protein
MKRITLQIEDDHYDIMQRLAVLTGMALEDMILKAAKCSLSCFFRLEVIEVMNSKEFSIQELLGGTDKG